MTRSIQKGIHQICADKSTQIYQSVHVPPISGHQKKSSTLAVYPKTVSLKPTSQAHPRLFQGSRNQRRCTSHHTFFPGLRDLT